MPIPPFTPSGVLPPFLGAAADAAGVSPYLVRLQEVVAYFGTTPRRREIMRGLIRYRSELRKAGITDGFQWLDGSFVEDQPTPGDVDVVTFTVPPAVTPVVRDLFTPPKTKAAFMCDAYIVPLQGSAYEIISTTTYFFGLFSHRRGTSERKGMLVSALNDPGDDAAATALLDKLDGNP